MVVGIVNAIRRINQLIIISGSKTCFSTHTFSNVIKIILFVLTYINGIFDISMVVRIVGAILFCFVLFVCLFVFFFVCLFVLQ